MSDERSASPASPRAAAGRRVLLAMQSAEPPPELLSTATALARRLQSELTGLFVEDLDLLRLAALPFAREIGLASGVSRPLDVHVVERALQRQAEQLRRQLAARAHELSLPWSFQTARGTLLEQALSVAAELDLIVFGRRWRPGMRAAGALFQPTAGHTVSALFDASEAGSRVLAAARELAQGQSEQLCLLVPAGSAASIQALRHHAADLLELPPEAPRVQPVALEAGDLARQVRQRRSGALVLSSRVLPDATRQIRMLLEVADCTVVLVR